MASNASSSAALAAVSSHRTAGYSVSTARKRASHPARPSSARKEPKSQKGSPGSPSPTNDGVDDDDPMATGFLHFCATCEKQITVPVNSTLYCSERCRRKDVSANPALPLYKADFPSPFDASAYSALDEFPIRDIVPQRSPTLHNDSKRFSFPGAVDVAAIDPFVDDTKRAFRSESEAARYLRQFQYTEHAHVRPRYARASTASVNAPSGTPSLSHTPASSVSTSIPYTPTSTQTRPLPPRTAHPGSLVSFTNRSSDLVTPVSTYRTAPSSLQSTGGDSERTLTAMSLKSTLAENKMSLGLVEPELLSYEKRTDIPASGSPVGGSLKQLFRFEEMRSRPTSSSKRL